MSPPPLSDSHKLALKLSDRIVYGGQAFIFEEAPSPPSCSMNEKRGLWEIIDDFPINAPS